MALVLLGMEAAVDLDFALLETAAAAAVGVLVALVLLGMEAAVDLDLALLETEAAAAVGVLREEDWASGGVDGEAAENEGKLPCPSSKSAPEKTASSSSLDAALLKSFSSASTNNADLAITVAAATVLVLELGAGRTLTAVAFVAATDRAVDAVADSDEDTTDSPGTVADLSESSQDVNGGVAVFTNEKVTERRALVVTGERAEEEEEEEEELLFRVPGKSHLIALPIPLNTVFTPAGEPDQ